MRRATSGLAALLLLGAVGCVDLDVKNLNEPDAERALSTPGDVESLIAGAYQAWYGCLYYEGPTMFLSSVSAEHVAPWGNSRMYYYSNIPRPPTVNQAGAPEINVLTQCWYRPYRAIAAVANGLKQLDAGMTLGTEGDLRARAYGKLMQGLNHATLALLYDSAFVWDETSDAATVVLQGYPAVMEAALGYLDDAIGLATGASFTIPETWMSHEVPAAEMVRLAHSWKARFMVNVARTPTERADVDWDAVRTEVAAGITQDWLNHTNCNDFTFCDDAMQYRVLNFWQMQNTYLAGMADTAGGFQTWINTAGLGKTPFIFHTPDLRWPQGATEAAQLAAPGHQFSMNSGGTRNWARPDRGTWRWSYYLQDRGHITPFFAMTHVSGEEDLPHVSMAEMRALIAEADFRDGNLAAVATYVNLTRTAHGLLATNAAGLNTNCVPKLPNGTCGNLWEMFKWEKRWTTQFMGPLQIGFYFDGRGWGDLMAGSFVQLPVPYGEMQLLGRAPYNYGGVGGPSAAPVGTYGY